MHMTSSWPAVDNEYLAMLPQNILIFFHISFSCTISFCILHRTAQHV